MYSEEIWKDIKGYEGKYQVSNLGRIRRISVKILKPAKQKNGYLNIGLYSKGKVTCYMVHRLVAKTFIPNTNKKLEINHIDENKENNCVNNLEWVTHLQNIKYGEGIKRRIKSKQKKVNQYDLQGNLIKTWNSIIEAADTLGINQSNICKACNEKRKTAYGFIWSYQK